MAKPLRSLTAATIGGLPVVDLVVALALSGYAAIDVGLAQGRGAAAALAAVTLTLPVAWCRRTPLAASAALAAGGVLNAVLFPSIVRCGVALPAVFIVAFFVGARCRLARAAAGWALCTVNVATQALSDPRLGASQLALLLPILVVFLALGRLVRAWSARIDLLRIRTAELQLQREETARLTVLADRERVSEEIDAELRALIARIGDTAVTSRAALENEPSAALAALGSVEDDGRDALRRMREIVAASAESPSASASPPGELPSHWSRKPLGAALVVTAALVVSGAATRGSPGGTATLLLAVPVVVAFVLGTRTRALEGLAGIALMSIGLQVGAGGAFNPLFEMITVGPWLAGGAVRANRRLAGRIEIRNRELESARALYAVAAVRCERARIAHELHDIVAHCITLVVVQAAAACRLAGAQPGRAAHALDAIVEATRDADTELALLSGSLDGTDPLGAPMIEELVRRSTAAGVEVRYRTSGELRRLHPPASGTAYRVVQESLTNAFKHAPGAPVDVDLRDEGRSFAVEVTTAAPDAGSRRIENGSGGHGLEAMRRRVAACGGTLAVGPTAGGGWRVSARLPARHVQLDPHAVRVGDVELAQ